MAGAFSRGSQTTTMNTMFFKPMKRKAAYHRKCSTTDTTSMVKMEAEEVNININRGQQQLNNIDQEADNFQKGIITSSNTFSSSSGSWVPAERTGIYYRKGHEKVIEDVPPGAAKDYGINWFNPNNPPSTNNNTSFH